jgi:hypothetical protein
MVDPLLVDEWDDRLPWKRTAGAIEATEVLRGSEETGLAVVLGSSPSRPSKSDLRELFRARSSGGVTPVLLAVSYPSGSEQRFTLLGLDDDAVPVDDLEPPLVEQLIKDALEAESPSGLHAEMSRRLGSLYGGVASGLRNEGLFASHVLEQQSTTPGWTALCETGQRHVRSRGAALLDGLGYVIENVPDGTVLREASGGHRRAAAVLLAEGESFDNPLSRFQNINAVTHGLALARRENLDWLVVLGGPVIRLYPISPDVGVGRKGQTQTFVELDMSLLSTKESAFLPLLFSAAALAAGGDIARLLDDSSKYALNLSARLRDRIYVDVVPALAVAVANRMGVARLPADEQKTNLDEAYHQTMIILFRLLFVAYGEDRGLLPYGTSDRYTRNALKTLALDLTSNPDQDFSSAATTLWDDLTQVWRVIDTGDVQGWGVPPYNGGLFTRDAKKNPSGAATYSLELTNDSIGPVLRGLLVDTTADGVPGPVDFRSLSVREFGTIYEGLLESGLAIAGTDLALDAQELYVPALPGQDVEVRAGDIYFHSRSGSRKATGSYFTKPFAVEHLLDSALEPALDRHLRRVKDLLSRGATKSAADALFDFRVTDLSMGSAHFLVAAVDRIEARFSAFLAENPLPEVAIELHALRVAAAEQLKLDPADTGIDDGVLLRRQIARRCIYGLDINEIAVELARLAVWIHTFVPGLPLSFLNHGLVWGNSLTGVGTLSEIGGALADAERRELKKKNVSQISGLDDALVEFLDRAAGHLESLGALSDASIADVSAAASVQSDLEGALEPLTALCDLITAERATRHLRPGETGKIRLADAPSLFTAMTADDLEMAVLSHPRLPDARALAADVMAAHLPVRFPEVFRRAEAGFDCILGNPPWEKIKVDEPDFWYLRAPETRLLTVPEFEKALPSLREDRPDLATEYESELARTTATRQLLAAANVSPDDGGDPDLSKFFAGRFWQLLRDGGYFGVVLPRTALSGSGTSSWRRQILSDGGFTLLVTCVNTGSWVFDGVEPRYTVTLVTAARGKDIERVARVCGPFHSLAHYEVGVGTPAELNASSVLEMTEGAAFPAIEDAASARVFEQMLRSPRFDDSRHPWSMRPLRELDTALAKTFAIADVGPEHPEAWPVYGGASFSIWRPDTGNHHSYAPAELAVATALRLLRSGRSRARSAYAGLPAVEPETDMLPCNRPRVAFRRIARSTDTRTFVCALLPPHVLVSNTAPTLLRTRGTARDEAFVLGVCSSIPFDWCARKVIEFSVAVESLNALPVPLPSPAQEHLADRIVQIAGRLGAVDKRYAGWAKDVGVPTGSVTTSTEQEALISELDAVVGILYGLSPDDLTTVFRTFHRGWDYAPRLARVLAHYADWATSDGAGATK